jgi:GT2 family glycosyltransferase
VTEQAQATTSGPQAGTRTAPTPLREDQVVAHNRWDLLDVPAIGGWEPRLSVSVVIPYYQAPDAIRLTLAALAEQTYPSELLEVIVVDDGSDPPLDLPDDLFGLHLTVLHQEDRGFGAPRARNLGARTATGDILVYFDSDMVPEPWTVEAHARWHHATTHALVLGFRRHVEYGELGPDDIRRAAAAGAIGTLFDGQEQQWPEWIDGHMVRTDDLTSAHDDIFRIVAGGNLSIRRERYLDIGGNDESFTQWGAEDTEFGYRAFVNGCVLVPDREARCWHQGFGHLPDPQELRSLEQQRAKIAHLIAHPGFRRTRQGRAFTVPRVVVEVDTAGASIEDVARTVRSVLAGTLSDLVVQLELDPELPGAVRLERELAGDDRVHLGVVEDLLRVPFELTLPAGAVVGEEALDHLVQLATDPSDPVGVLRVTVPDRAPADASATFVSRRALGRARFAGASDDDAVEVAGRLFRVRWVSGLDLPLTWHDFDELPEPEPQPAGTSELDQLQELWASLRRLGPDQRTAVIAVAGRVLGAPARQRALLVRIGHRVVRLVAAAGMLRAVRRPDQLRRALGELAAAVLPFRVTAALRRRRSGP